MCGVWLLLWWARTVQVLAKFDQCFRGYKEDCAKQAIVATLMIREEIFSNIFIPMNFYNIRPIV